jgi:hypothetical protein
MHEIDLFAMYRHALLVVVGTYTTVRLIQFIWRWRLAGLAAPRPEALLRRWVEVSVLRLRLGRFRVDALQIAALAALLLYLLSLQVGPPTG